ncbi:cysteine-rich receptor-like protein kinase 25 [Amaranthus tricolor]|uniref:cysteine-rich receptor-like protein kinase 25 n=1 Tax=Amaranthus tricolor TaxID=29722 RepID=UPI00258E6796|nr:cysteine-rich receptor-like protein kinase 25 [Amaranthus tricolor]XP_057538359.1 cysteine-rich receptor-like protein kinase 25 [Amaranthus tricolor]
MAYCFISLFSSLLFLLTLTICLIIHVAVADPVFASVYCPDIETVAPNSKFQSNVNTFLSLLNSTLINDNHFYNTTVGSGANKVYGSFFCRIDQTIAFCQECISLAINSLNSHCPGKKNSIVWYDQCMLRYSNGSFFGIMNDSPMVPVWEKVNDVDMHNMTSNISSFTEVVLKTLGDVSYQAATSGSGKKFSTKEARFRENLTRFNIIYSLAECTPDISGTDCTSCLHMIVRNMTELCNKRAGCTVLNPSCNMKVGMYPFYGDALSPGSKASHVPFFGDTPGSKRRKNLIVLLGIIISAILAMVIVFAVWFCACRKTSKLSFIEAENQIEIEESLKFDLTTIRKATNNFSAVNKLGEGGFGEVYKGKLDNGRCIAIKRLSSKSQQGIDEFKTEVVLVAKLQHRNLVKLLGFCLSGKEKILVYEFLPNMSLDRFLSDPEKRASLNWKTRCKIIKGIVRGLLYLHEDSRLKIIHRDLKPSNILLDESMNPRIADFGTAKLFGVDQTQDNTDKIVGTLGYMAPEYLIAGHFSVKSDVYSFGILILELVSGLRNKYGPYQQTNEALLFRAWRLWNEGKPLKLADPSLGSDFEPDELSKCIHIGLLCIQEDAAKRPRMALIAGMLNGEMISLPSPTPPRFFGGSTDVENQESCSSQGAGASGFFEDVSELYAR